MITKNNKRVYLMVLLITLTMFSMLLSGCKTVSYESKAFSKLDLHDVFLGYISGEEEELSFFCEDFDNNGTLEAFATAVRFDECLDEEFLVYPASIYFIDDAGGVQEVFAEDGEEWQTFMDQQGRVVDDGNVKFFVWEEEAINGSSTSHIFAVKNGKYYEPNISGTVGDFGFEDGRYVTATVIYHDPARPDDIDLYWRRNLIQHFIYDKERDKFIETGREVTDGY